MSPASKLLDVVVLAVLSATVQLGSTAAAEWPVYGGTPGGTRWSPLSQINITNVHLLKPAWIYRCDDMRPRPPSTIECNPLILDGTLYLTTPGLKVAALEAATGREKWMFDPWNGGRASGVNRGLAIWTDGNDRRIFTAAGPHLLALDARTGRLVESFGNAGRVDMREGLDRELLRQSLGLTTPGVVYRDLLIVGSQVGDSPNARVPGHIRAYDVRTGRRRWIFHTIPHPGETGYETWPSENWKWAAGCNAWGGFSLDPERGLVFCGTGSPAYDHYGGDRHGMNLFGNCVLALDALTGVRRWHFQVVHHDLWDYDLPCPPVLGRIHQDGKPRDVAIQATKTGHVFVLDRTTGEPVFPVEERPVPASQIPGELAWPTQPFPTRPPPIAMQGLTLDEVTDLSPAHRRSVLDQLRTIKPAPLYAPPALERTVVMPQFNGGAEWGGQAFNPDTGYFFVNTSNEAEWMSMTPARPTTSITLNALGEHLFSTLCSTCHGSTTALAPGTPPPPSLDGLARRVPKTDTAKLLETGRNQMPSFASLSELERRALVAFLYAEGHDTSLDPKEIKIDWADRIRFVDTGHKDFRDHEGYPVNKRPWGVLSAVNLNQGTIAWQVPLGTYPELEKRGYSPTGTFNIGGPIATAGGLVFIAATRDERFRAFDQRDGKVLWEFQLDAGGYATPATFEAGGRQYVVVAAGGGGKAETKPGNAYWCFALPK
ncbi:MAG: pyrroloquinoline quinone-dependent dehydrogenase [Verrucomicrobia bacterium]|nr:pyrroloquinoline quinone-dependent dehydrogenase [Verrucomicrobiota bacterium]